MTSFLVPNHVAEIVTQFNLVFRCGQGATSADYPFVLVYTFQQKNTPKRQAMEKWDEKKRKKKSSAAGKKAGTCSRDTSFLSLYSEPMNDRRRNTDDRGSPSPKLSHRARSAPRFSIEPLPLKGKRNFKKKEGRGGTTKTRNTAQAGFSL